MTQSINLIPREEQELQQKEKIIKTSSIFAVFLVLIVGIVSGYYIYLVRNLEGEIATSDAAIQRHRASIQALSEIETTARSLDAKFNTLNTLFATSRHYSILFSELNKRVPKPSILVSSFSITGDDQETLNLSGYGADYNSIALFLNTLSDTQFSQAGDNLGALFTDVTLNSVTLDAQDGSVSFFIVSKYVAELLK